MSAYSTGATIDELIAVAHPFGEETVIREVARRAGLLWSCRNARCQRDNTGEGGACAYCSYPAPDPPDPPWTWRCVCRALNAAPVCFVCHRKQP